MRRAFAEDARDPKSGAGLHHNAARLKLGDRSVDPSCNSRAVGVCEFADALGQTAPGQGATGTDLDATIPVGCKDFADAVLLLLAMERAAQDGFVSVQNGFSSLHDKVASTLHVKLYEGGRGFGMVSTVTIQGDQIHLDRVGMKPELGSLPGWLAEVTQARKGAVVEVVFEDDSTVLIADGRGNHPNRVVKTSDVLAQQF
jgi:hypothetical protein